MKNLDDGPDGLNDAAFDRMLGGGRKRTRKPAKALAQRTAAEFRAEQSDLATAKLTGHSLSCDCTNCCLVRTEHYRATAQKTVAECSACNGIGKTCSPRGVWDRCLTCRPKAVR